MTPNDDFPSDKFLSTVFMTIQDNQVVDKCLCTADIKGEIIKFCLCNSTSSLLLWQVTEVDDGEFLLKHGGSGNCLRQIERNVAVTKCHLKDPTFRWKFNAVYPLSRTCGKDKICDDKLHVEPSFKLYKKFFKFFSL